jgi:hypothetical protein
MPSVLIMIVYFMAFLEKGITQATAHMRSKKPKIMEHESGGSLNLDPDL